MPRTIQSTLMSLALAACLLGQGTTLLPRNYKGTNYLNSSAVTTSNFMASLPLTNLNTHAYGHYVPEATYYEIEHMAAQGVNNLRVIPSFYAWLTDRASATAALRELCQACNAHGVKITFIVWSAIGLGAPCVGRDSVLSPELWHDLVGSDPNAPTNYELYIGATCRELAMHNAASSQFALPPGETLFGSMHHEPGNELIAMSGDDATWPYDLQARITAYLTFIADFFRNDPDGALAFASFDLFNEPNGGATTFNIPIQNYLTFIQSTYARLSAVFPTAHYTIGWAGADGVIDALDAQARAAGVPSTYLSFHSYSGPEFLREDALARKAYATSLGIDAVCSEFYRTDVNAGQLRHLLDALADAGVGGQMWGFLQSNVFTPIPGAGFAPIDGLFAPVLHASTTAPVTFDIQNAEDALAFTQWAQGTLNPPPMTKLVVHDEDGAPSNQIRAGGGASIFIESSLIGEPVLLVASGVAPGVPVCANPAFGECLVVPGVGFVYRNSTTLLIPIGTLPSTGRLTVVDQLLVPQAWAGAQIVLQGYVGFGPPPTFAFHHGELTRPTILNVY